MLHFMTERDLLRAKVVCKKFLPNFFLRVFKANYASSHNSAKKQFEKGHLVCYGGQVVGPSFAVATSIAPVCCKAKITVFLFLFGSRY